MLLRTAVWFCGAWPARTMRTKTSTICQIRRKVTKQVSNYFGLILEKCKKNIIFAKNSPFWSKFLSKSGVIDTRNDLLRELFAANVQCIKSVRAVGTVSEEVFLGLGKLLAGLVFVEAIASVQNSGRLNGEDKIIVILTVEKRHQTSICPPSDCPKLLDNTAAVIN